MRVKVPATTANLGPGFDCLGLALSLYNTVTFEKLPQAGACVLTATGEGSAEVPLDESNLVYQVYRKTLEAAGAPVYGVKMDFDNQIPFARGLGSSSAAIVAGAVMANYFLDNHFSEEALLDICMTFEGHPDNIAPALAGGAVLSGLDEAGKVYFRKITPPKDLHCTLIVPDYPLATSKARAVLPEVYPKQDAVYNISRTALLVDGLHRGDVAQIARAMTDKLHQPYREPLIKGMAQVKAKAEALGALAVVISGAGPTLLAVSDKACDLAPLAEVLAPLGVSARILPLQPENQGAVVQ